MLHSYHKFFQIIIDLIIYIRCVSGIFNIRDPLGPIRYFPYYCPKYLSESFSGWFLTSPTVRLLLLFFFTCFIIYPLPVQNSYQRPLRLIRLLRPFDLLPIMVLCIYRKLLRGLSDYSYRFCHHRNRIIESPVSIENLKSVDYWHLNRSYDVRKAYDIEQFINLVSKQYQKNVWFLVVINWVDRGIEQDN